MIVLSAHALPCLALPCLAFPYLALPNDFFLGGGTISFFQNAHTHGPTRKREKTGMGGGGGAGAQIQAIGNPLVGRAALLCDTQLTAHVRAALTERIGQKLAQG